MKNRGFLVLFYSFLLSCVLVSYAWLAAAKNTMQTSVSGSLVSDYFHCGIGTEDNPFVITRPIHYYHMVEFFQRETSLDIVYRVVDGVEEYVHFGTTKLYFQIGCPEEQLYDPDAEVVVSSSTKYYVFEYTNTGEVVKKTNEDGSPYLDDDGEEVDAYCQNLNMAYYSNNKALMPTGSSSKPFYGVFDGKGLTVSNINIITSSQLGSVERTTSDVGIFGVVKCDTVGDSKSIVESSIKNVYFDNVSISLQGTSKNSPCTVTGSLHPNDCVYIGYLVGHLYEFNNAQNRDYLLNQVGVSADPVSNVYVNNATITGGTTDLSMCEFGYFGHVDLLDGETAVSLTSQIEESGYAGSGDQSWGGSIDMTSLYERLETMIDTGSNMTRTVPTSETIIASSTGEVRTSITGTKSAGRNDNSSNLYYWSAADFGSPSADKQENTTGGTVIGTMSNTWIYLYGMKDLGLTTTTTYSKSGESVVAYYINDNGIYIAIEEGQISEATISKNAAKFCFSNKGGKGTVFNYGEYGIENINYLKATSDFTTIEITQSSSEATQWTNSLDSEGNNRLYCENGSTRYYLIYDNGWKLTTGVEYYTICDANNHYLSANTSGVTNVNSQNDSVSWQVSTSDSVAYLISFIAGTTSYYLNVSNGKLTVTTTQATWTKEIAGANVVNYYTEKNGVRYYLVYENGWRAKELNVKVITDGSHYLYADMQMVSSTSSDGATSFHLSDESGSTTIYTIIDGVNYYLVNDGTNLYTTTDSTDATWSKNSAGYYRVVDSVEYYLVYQDGWKAAPLSGYKIHSDSHYLSYQTRTDGETTTYSISSTTSENAVLWQISNNQIYVIIGNDRYYLSLNYEGNLYLSAVNYDCLWNQDEHGYFTYKNNGDKFYLSYDKGFTATIIKGYLISDGSGHYLSKAGSTVGVTNQANATVWQLTNSAIASGDGESYIYTIVGTTRYYLYETGGSLALYEAGQNNMIDYSLDSYLSSSRLHYQNVYFSKENKSFTMVNLPKNAGDTGAYDPYSTINHTVHLEAGVTYYMNIDISFLGYTQVFYAINASYSEGNSRMFYYETQNVSFTVDTTGDYLIRFDNEASDYDSSNYLRTINNFYISDIPYYNFDIWHKNSNGYNLTTADGDNVYLNYNADTNKWELVTTGGNYIYSTVGTENYYLNATGSSLSSTNNSSDASLWFFNENKVYTYVGTTKYYLTYEEKLKEVTEEVLDPSSTTDNPIYNTVVVRSYIDVLVKLTTDSSQAFNVLSDDNGYLYVSFSDFKFYLFFDTNDTQWKLKPDLTSGYLISDSSKTHYVSVSINNSVPYLKTETDANCAALWYYVSNKYFTFIGTTKYFLDIDVSAKTNLNGLKIATSASYSWSTMRPKIKGIYENLYYSSNGWVVTHNKTFTISNNGNYLNVSGTSVKNSTNASTTRKWILICESSSSSTLNDTPITTESNGMRAIATIVGGNAYALTSNSSGVLSLVKVDFSKVANYQNYLWGLDDIGYYTLVNGVKMYLMHDGTKWRTTAAQIIISKYGTSNYLTISGTENSYVLPDGYQQLEYLESTNAQLSINTGVVPNTTTGIEITFAALDTQTDSCVFGQRASTGDTKFWAGVYGGDVFISYNNSVYASGGTSAVSGTISAYQKVIVGINYYNNRYRSFNGSNYSQVSDTLASTTNPIYLFGAKDNNLINQTNFRIYDCRITQDTTLIRDYIPCCQLSTNLLGMYDLVNDVFYPASDDTNHFTNDDSINYNIVLPARYQVVSYIASSGTQYINTGYYASNTTGVELIMSDNDVSTDLVFFGARSEQNGRFWIGSSGSGFYYGFNTNVYANSGTIGRNVSPNTIYNLKLNYLNNRKRSIDGCVFSDIGSTTLAAQNHTLGIFTGNEKGNLDENRCSIHLYRCTITEGTEIVRRFIPCYDKVDGTVGLYETCQNRFYTNDGTGSFAIGPNINFDNSDTFMSSVFNLPDDYIQLEYITTNGNQYIDTGIKPNQDYVVDALVSNGNGNMTCLWSARQEYANTSYTLFTTSRMDYYNSSSDASNTPLTVGAMSHVTQSANMLFINGSCIKNMTYGTFTTPNNLYLMGLHNGSGTAVNSTYNFIGKFYGCKIYNDSGVLVKYYVPCYQKSTGKFGVYDIVNSAFVRSSSGTDFLGGNLYISNITSSESAQKWTYVDSKISTEIAGSTYYLAVNSEGSLEISQSSFDWSSVNTTNGVSFQANVTMLDGNQSTYALEFDGDNWKIAPLKYFEVKDGSNYFSVSSSGVIGNSTTSNDTTKLFVSNKNVSNGSGTTLLYVNKNGTNLYLNAMANDLSLYFSDTPSTYWSMDSKSFYTEILGVKFELVYVNSNWKLVPKEKLIYTSNGVTLGMDSSSLKNTQTDLFVDSNNRVFTLVNGEKYFINFANNTSTGLTVSTSTINAMMYDSTNKKIYRDNCYLYYDSYASNWNVYRSGSTTISSGSNNLRISGVTSFTNTTNGNQASYFYDNNGVVSSYYNGQLVYLRYDSGLSVSSTSSTWIKTETASGTAGTKNAYIYINGSRIYTLTISGTTWQATQCYEFKIGNSDNGSTSSFIYHNGSRGDTDDSQAISIVTGKSNASVWSFSYYSDESNTDIDFMYHVVNSKNYYLGYSYSDSNWWRIRNDTSYKDDWKITSEMYLKSVKNVNYFNFTSTAFADQTAGTKLYFYPNITISLSFNACNQTVTSSKEDVMNNYPNLSAQTNDKTPDSIVLTYYGSYHGNTFTSSTYGSVGKRTKNAFAKYYAKTETPANTLVPNVSFSTKSGNSNVVFDFISPSDINSGVEVRNKTYSAANITISKNSDLPSINLIQTTDKPFSPTIENYQRGCYVALRIASQTEGTNTPYSDYRADVKNTGYVVGGDYSSASGSGQGDIRVSRYSSGNIESSYNRSSRQFTTLYTFNDSGLQAINDNANSYTEYQRTRTDFLSILSQNTNYVYGLHFMNTAISTSHIITAESVLINGKTYANYQLPESCIDFNVYQKGTIVLYAGDYYGGNSCFFSLNQVFRNNKNEITEIKEITEIYSRNGASDKESYVYKYSDNTFSKTIANSDLAANYTCVFKTQWLTNPNNNRSFSNDYIYYFEIPCNKGEYALGSVSGRDGGYLLYLDIASNGTSGVSYNQDAGVSDEPLFTQIDFRNSGTTINSPMNFAYTIPDNNTADNFNVSINFDGEYMYTITIVNRTGNEMDLSVLLVDNDDDPDNVLPFEYRIIYNGNIYTLGLGYNESNQSYSTTAGYTLPASS